MNYIETKIALKNYNQLIQQMNIQSGIERKSSNGVLPNAGIIHMVVYPPHNGNMNAYEKEGAFDAVVSADIQSRRLALQSAVCDILGVDENDKEDKIFVGYSSGNHVDIVYNDLFKNTADASYDVHDIRRAMVDAINEIYRDYNPGVETQTFAAHQSDIDRAKMSVDKNPFRKEEEAPDYKHVLHICDKRIAEVTQLSFLDDDEEKTSERQNCGMEM